MRRLLPLLLLLPAVAAVANPIGITSTPFGETAHPQLFFVVAGMALLVEYLVIRALLQPHFRAAQVLIAFLVINVITFPATTVISASIGWGAELLPLVLEPLMYAYAAKQFALKVPGLPLKVIAANLASFGAGLALFHLLPQLFVSR